jgi:LacI family transcriptional regulator
MATPIPFSKVILSMAKQQIEKDNRQLAQRIVPVRMKDIARDLGLSTVTISKVLRNHSDISEATRKKVLKRMKEMDYRPNLAARSLITGRSWTIGLVVPDLLYPFFAQIAKALAAEIRKQGYSLIITSSEEDPELEKQEIEQLLTRRVDVIAIASSQWTVESFRSIEQHRIPYILIDRYFRGLAANFVGVDDVAAGKLAADHLIEQGCRRIVHIRGPEVSTALGRLDGFQRGLAAHKLTPLNIVSSSGSVDGSGSEGGYETMHMLLQKKTIPDGVFCYNDPIAMGAMRAILDAGLRIPEDIAVVGCGNVLNADFLRVPLSTIDQDSTSIGTRAAELAMSLTTAKTTQRPKTHLTKPKLIIRASSQRRK